MIKFISEILPLIAFFVGYKIEGILTATFYMLVVSVIAIIVTYIHDKSFNKVNIFSTVILIISYAFTYFSGNNDFIKMKPTLLYSCFSLVFLISNYLSKPVIKHLFAGAFEFKNDEIWFKLSGRFAIFFIFMAILNEIVWRNYSEDIWVNFKVFGTLPLTIGFMLSQFPYIMRHNIKKI